MSIVTSRAEALATAGTPSEVPPAGLLIPMVLLVVGNLALDLLLPFGYAAGVLYILPVLVCLAGRSTRLTMVTAAVGIVLTIVGYWLAPTPYVSNTLLVVNRTLSLFALVSVAAAVIAKQRAEEARIQAARALAESEVRLQIAFQHAPTGIAIQSPDGRFMKVNDAATEMLGYRAEDLLGRTIADIAHPEDLPRLDAVRAGPLAEHGWARLETRFIRGDGGVVWVQLSLALVRDADGTPLYVIAQGQDVTAQKAAEAALRESFARELAEVERHRKLEEQLRRAQKMEAVGRLAGGIAHDFNNMLSIILNYATLAERRLGPDSPARPDLAAIRDAGNRAATLTRQLLLFAGRHVADPSPIPIDVTVANIAQLLRRMLGEDIEVVVHLHAPEAHVMVDASHLEQVLMNLGVNARDAMPDGGELVIRTGLVDGVIDDTVGTPGRRVAITVSDTGAGMATEVQARAFEPFYTTKPVGQGTGLGLAIVYGIIEQAGGDIELHSEPGRGTTFRILLPTHEAAQPVPSREPPSARPPGGRGEWVLVVEDEPALRTLTARLLSGRGYNVLTAKDGVDALEVLERHPGALDLLLTDVVMPRMSGRELATRVVALRPDVRVLYVSGHAEDRIARHRLLHTGAALLSKPFHMDDLLRHVRDSLDEGRSPDEDRHASL